jgi:hypothetical protein
MNVAFYAAAQGRVKLREVADLQENYLPRPLRYFSASIAAAQPEPAAVIACL